jgi:H+/Cl- antiporter ClcA
MGGSAAEAVNQFFKVNLADTKILLMSGISAGFGAVFGMEMIALGKLKYEAFVPCLTASFVGHYVASAAWSYKHEKFIIQYAYSRFYIGC